MYRVVNIGNTFSYIDYEPRAINCTSPTTGPINSATVHKNTIRWTNGVEQDVINMKSGRALDEAAASRRRSFITAQQTNSRRAAAAAAARVRANASSIMERPQ